MKEADNFNELKDKQLESVIGGSVADHGEIWKIATDTPIELGDGAVGCPNDACKDASGNPTVMS